MQLGLKDGVVRSIPDDDDPELVSPKRRRETAARAGAEEPEPGGASARMVTIDMSQMEALLQAQ